MTAEGNNMHRSETTPSSSTTNVSKFEAYSLPARCPSFFFTETYTGKNAVTIMPPHTSS